MERGPERDHWIKTCNFLKGNNKRRKAEFQVYGPGAVDDVRCSWYESRVVCKPEAEVGITEVGDEDLKLGRAENRKLFLP